MTVTYAAKVATCKGLGVFWKLLFSWRASIYKLIWPNLLLYVLCWYALKGIYLLVPDNDFRYYFIKSSMYCNSYSQFIPLTFILGFYVNLVVKRWWEMFQALPGLDTIAIFVSTSIHGQDERSRLLRRTIMRYLNLSYVMVMSMISTPVKKRFPTMKHMEEAGLMNDNEHAIFEEMNKKSKLAKYWMPIVWAGSIVSRARKEGRIRDDFAVKTLLDELCKFRSGCGSVLGYDWVPIPLVYTQVVTIAVYSYCVSTLCGSQFSFKAFKSDIEKQFASEFTSGEVNGAEYVRGHSDTNIIYFPLFDFLQFFFYMGWMKVAESLVNPFGEDDDDFETNFLVDKNLTNTYLIVDEMHQEHPTLLKDQFWDSIVPELPYTYATEKYHKDPHMGSAANISIDSEDGEFVPMEALEEEEEEVAMGDEENQVGSVSDKDKPDSRKGSFRRSSISASDRFSRIGSRPNLRQKASMISTIAKVFGSRADSVAGSRVSLASTRRNTRRISRQNSTQGPMTRNTTAADEIFNMSGLSLNKLDGHYENGLSGSRANIAGKHNPSEPIKIDGASVAEGDKPNFVIGSDTSAKKMMVYCGDDLDMVDAELPVTARPHTRLDSLLEDDAEDRDGFMTVEDFGLLCRTLFRNEEAKPYDIEDQQIKDIFDVFDLNEDIVLDVDEFRLCWQHWIKKVVRPCSALLVVDVQNDFISGSLSVSNCPAKHNGEEVLEPINMMVNEVPFHYVFYTMDWHPSSHVSFVENVKMRPIDETSQVKAEEAAVLDTVIFAGPPPYEQKLWPTHCVQNSWGAELHKDLVVVEEGMFVHKGEDPEVDFYSAFLDNKRTTYTKLDDELKRRRVTDVYCCGLAHDICVGKTAIDAVDFGYRTVLVDDACRGVSLEDIQCTNETLQKKSAVIVSSSKVRNMVRGLDRRPELGYHCAMMLKGKLPTLTPPKSPLSPSDFQRCMHLED